MTPRFAKAFADALLAEPTRKVTIPGFDPPLVGSPRIGHERSIQYRDRDSQKLHRVHEYTFRCEGLDPIEVSLQFYEDDRSAGPVRAASNTKAQSASFGDLGSSLDLAPKLK